MYSVVVEAGFTARHWVFMPDGSPEPRHSHDWLVRAHFARATLDDHGMVIDFLEARGALEEEARSLEDTDLNALPGEIGRTPTAEVVARHFFDRLAARGLAALRRVEVTEAPGCVAAYEPPP